MSFGGFGGGGFGQNNQQSTGFGGFGANNNTTTTGFGSTGTTGFGASTTTQPATGGLFGGGTTGTTGFGSSTFGTGTGFGAAKPAFGTATTTSGGGLFGSTTATAGGTGFGSTGFGANTASTSTTTPFGGGTTSLFGGAKPATTGFGTGTTGFGTGTSTGGGLFGGGSTATTGTGFGATNNPGIGTNVGDPPGTAAVPFTATVEKESNNPSQSNAFQNILFMDAYKRWSADELRLTDYNQGRRHGSAGGTGTFGGSGFGTTSGFGANAQTGTGFGTTTTTGTGLFGAAPAATGGFGQTAPAATSAFGSTAGGGLFGAAKPATTGGLFGSTAAQPAATGGGLFGATTGTGFGANTGTTGFGAAATNTGGGLFGAANNAAKPAGFSFGNTGGTGFGAAATTNTGFGATNTATNTGGGLFGAAAQPAATGGGLFGAAAQQQQPAATGFGGGFGAQAQNTGGGLFGAANQAKPAGGLFGASTTTNTGATGGLFGGGNANSTGFGAANNTQQQSGGLFGAKPAATGGLFGTANNTQTNTGGGLFGGGLGASTQQPAQNSLFGGQNNQQKPSLFGGQQSTGGGLFGGQQAQQSGGGLFGNSTQQQTQGGLGNSLLGNSQNNSAQQQSFSTSINDLSAYGSATLFSGLPDDKIQNPGPLATPLSAKTKAKSRSILPMYKLSPANANRFNTPQKRGFGFSYSNYGSPASPSSAASTPGGFGQSLLVGSMNRSLSKSISASNLRRSFNPEDSILTPGAFSASTGNRLLIGSGSTGSHKRLVINREMRSDLFTPPTKESPTPEGVNGARKLAKRVSFDTSANEGTSANNTEQRPIEDVPRPSTDDRSSGLPAPTRSNGQPTASAAGPPEMEQIRGNELAIVPEEASPVSTRSRTSTAAKTEGGTYWMSPRLEELRALNRAQLKKVPNFTVGREHVGSVAFKVPVDLTGINLDELFGVIVVLEPRSATVYPVAAKKPPVGKGLNVPAVISLEQSFPRQGPATSGRKLEKHIEKLRSQKDTTFLGYDREQGVWTFSVEHFTTYGLSDDDDDDMDETTTLEAATISPAVQASSSPETGNEDDTFEFKRSRRAVPGAFDMEAYDEEELSGAVQPLGLPAAGPEMTIAPVRPYESDDESMEGAQDYQYEASQHSPGSDDEHDDTMGVSRFAEHDVQVPAGIMRARMRAVKKSTAPTKIEVAGGDDWTQILRASVRAPRTVDRARLRALNESGAAWDMKDRGSPAPHHKVAPVESAGFATSIDLMKSLFDQAKGPTQPEQALPAKGFVKWPYQQRTNPDHEEMSPMPRPTWGPNQLLVTAHDNETNLQPVDGGNLDSGSIPLAPRTLAQLQQYIEIASAHKGHFDTPRPDLQKLAQGDSLWEVASILSGENRASFAAFWKGLVSEATKRALLAAPTPEEKAIVCLAGNEVADACGNLLAARDFRLANLVSCIGTQTKVIRNQLKDWQESNVLSEFAEPVRALYELLAGNAGVCAGPNSKDVPVESRITSFTISQRFGLDWTQAFGLRLFYTTGKPPGSSAGVAAAVRSFQDDIEQGKEPEPDSPLWTLLKIFAFGQFDWSDDRLDWLLTRAIYSTNKVSFGADATEKLDRASLAFASTLTAQAHWVPATFVLLQLSDPASREAAVRDHLGRHAHLLGARHKDASAFAVLRRFGVAEPWIWEAKALAFRARQDSRQEFLALLWAGNYKEANHAFLHRVGPDLVIARDYGRMLRFAQLLHKVRRALPDWERGAVVYMLYPMARAPAAAKALDQFDDALFDGLGSLRGMAHGDVRQEAAVADMAEELIRIKGGDPRLYQLLPEDVRGRYMRNQALDNIR